MEDMGKGEGTVKWPGGDKYIGDFRNGQIEGHGRSQFSHGAFYIGGWVDGKYEGFGGTSILCCSIKHCGIALVSRPTHSNPLSFLDRPHVHWL